MAKKSPRKEVEIDPVEKLFEGTTGTKNSNLNMKLINQAAASLWIPEGTSPKERIKHISYAISLLKGIKPVDEIESMLAIQMVATHSAAMECLRRAMLTNQTFAGVEQSLKHAAKLLVIYARQMDALNKNRGKGQQKVTVEHVHVEAGGQAVVGNVHAAPNPEASSPKAPVALTHAPGETLNMNAKLRVPAKQRDK